MCADGIHTATYKNVYLLEKYETSSLQAIYYVIINGKFTVIGGYMYGGINNVPVITEKWISKQSNNNINNNNPEIQIENREIHFHPRSIQMTKSNFVRTDSWTCPWIGDFEVWNFFIKHNIYGLIRGEGKNNGEISEMHALL